MLKVKFGRLYLLKSIFVHSLFSTDSWTKLAYKIVLLCCVFYEQQISCVNEAKISLSRLAIIE